MSLFPDKPADSQQSPVHTSVAQLLSLSRYSHLLRLDLGAIRSARHGGYHSRFKGRGMEFSESRDYQPGDDIRNIDWRVTARTGRAHTKLFCEERERPVFIAVDLRRSMFFATRGRYKSVVATEIAALLAWSAQAQGDRIGGVLFSDAGCRELKPTRGRASVLNLIRAMVHHPAWESDPSPTESLAIEQPLLRLRRMVHPGSLVVMVSDFRTFNDTARSQLLWLTRHNDLLLIMVYDPLEMELPEQGRYRISDGQQQREIDTSSSEFRHRYQHRFQRQYESLQQFCRSNRIHLLTCTTRQSGSEMLQGALG